MLSCFDQKLYKFWYELSPIGWKTLSVVVIRLYKQQTFSFWGSIMLTHIFFIGICICTIVNELFQSPKCFIHILHLNLKPDTHLYNYFVVRIRIRQYVGNNMGWHSHLTISPNITKLMTFISIKSVIVFRKKIFLDIYICLYLTIHWHQRPVPGSVSNFR